MTTSVDRLLAQLSIPAEHYWRVNPKLLCVHPDSITTVRAKLTQLGQRQWLRYLDRDYRASNMPINSEDLTLILHKGPLSAPVPSTGKTFARGVGVPHTYDPGNTSSGGWFTNPPWVVTNDVLVGSATVELSATGGWWGGPTGAAVAFTKVFGGRGVGPTRSIRAVGYGGGNGGSGSPPVSEYPFSMQGVALQDISIQPLRTATLQNWHVVAGPAVLTRAEYYSHHEFSFQLATFLEAATALELAIAQVRDANERARMTARVNAMKATPNAVMGRVWLGAASWSTPINPFDLHWQTRADAAELRAMTSVLDGVDFAAANARLVPGVGLYGVTQGALVPVNSYPFLDNAASPVALRATVGGGYTVNGATPPTELATADLSDVATILRSLGKTVVVTADAGVDPATTAAASAVAGMAGRPAGALLSAEGDFGAVGEVLMCAGFSPPSAGQLTVLKAFLDASSLDDMLGRS